METTMIPEAREGCQVCWPLFGLRGVEAASCDERLICPYPNGSAGYPLISQPHQLLWQIFKLSERVPLACPHSEGADQARLVRVRLGLLDPNAIGPTHSTSHQHDHHHTISSCDYSFYSTNTAAAATSTTTIDDDRSP